MTNFYHSYFEKSNQAFPYSPEKNMQFVKYNFFVKKMLSGTIFLNKLKRINLRYVNIFGRIFLVKLLHLT